MTEQSFTILQRVILPDESRADRTKLYVNHRQGPVRLDLGSGMPVVPASLLDFCTLFGAFSFRKWRDTTGIEDLNLRVAGAGRIRLTLALYTVTGAAWNIRETEFELSEEGSVIALPPLSTLSGDLIGFEICGLADPAVLHSIVWETREPVRRDVRLAAVITTFGREAAVKRAMDTFSECTCANPPVGQVELFVIDNEQRLHPSCSDHVTIIPNPNLGGAGGFARGLREVLDAGTFTHVLFMDDDAACEPESVWRAMTLLAYAADPSVAVAGAMLLVDRPTIQTEKGGVFDRSGRSGTTWIAHNHYYDLAERARVCENEADREVNYGAWWFFAFPLACVTAMPFPFFVRGDDVDFSLSNKFKIVTLNGIATWCDSFGTKLGPVTEYLASRAWMALALIHGEPQAAFLSLWNRLRDAENTALRFDYAAMNAILDGVEDAMRGPEFFRDNPKPLQKLKMLKDSRTSDALTLAEFSSLVPPIYGDRRSERKARKSWGGHLYRMSDRRGIVGHFNPFWPFSKWGLSEADKAVVGDGAALDTLKRDRQAFLAGKWRMTKMLWTYRFRLASVQRRYAELGPAIRSRAYWDPLFAGQGQRSSGP